MNSDRRPAVAALIAAGVLWVTTDDETGRPADADSVRAALAGASR
ncbi:MAG TPA: hypothetical protein VLW50_20265 [Streptosporangiaceae bacterium]|nr:hypothetical protein [Streptosporangiaceae bacterium]